VPRWLNDQERSWLISTLETERRLIEAKRKVSLWESFWNPKVLWLTLNYLGIVTASAGMLLFLPQIIKQVVWVTMIPYLRAVIAMLAWGWISDRLGERRWTLCFACLVSAAGLIIAAQVSAMGFYASKGPFWSILSMILIGATARRPASPGLYALAAFDLMRAVISALGATHSQSGPRSDRRHADGIGHSGQNTLPGDPDPLAMMLLCCNRPAKSAFCSTEPRPLSLLLRPQRLLIVFESLGEGGFQ
jgi:hypothetical protein